MPNIKIRSPIRWLKIGLTIGLPIGIAIALVFSISAPTTAAGQSAKYDQAPKYQNKAGEPPRNEEANKRPALNRPQFGRDTAQDPNAMKEILDETLGLLRQRKLGAAIRREAALTAWNTLHMSGIAAILPTPGVPETVKIFAGSTAMIREVIDVFWEVAKQGDDQVAPLVLELKVGLEAELDAMTTLAAWTAVNDPNSPQAVKLAKHLPRAAFVPYAPFRSPQKDIRSDVISKGQCFIVLKEIHGIIHRLVAKLIPVWVEPWYARRRIVGHKVVWRLEWVPAEYIKRLVTCMGPKGITRHVFKDVVVEPELLLFSRFYAKDP